MPEDLPVRRKRTAEMAGSYDWTPQLIEPGFCAAPVSCFKHVSVLFNIKMIYIYKIYNLSFIIFIILNLYVLQFF